MPQGLVVGPFGFPSYTRPVRRICAKHGIAYYFYADDLQLYLAFRPKDEYEARRQLGACIQEIKEWMQRNFLKLNDAKTEFLVIGSNKKLQHVTNHTIQMGEDMITASTSARNIGAIFDSKMNMKEHVHTICKSCYCYLRNLGKVKHCLTQEVTLTLIHAFMSSKIDHINAFLYGIPKYLTNKLQRIQNNAARIVTINKCRDHITLILVRLHWLSLEKRIEYKVLLTTFKAQYGLGPWYISDLIRHQSTAPYSYWMCICSINPDSMEINPSQCFPY